MASKHTKTLALSAVIAALISTGVSAQDHTGEITLQGGRVFFDDPLEDADTWGISFGMPISENWTLEAVASRYDSETSVGGVDVDGTQYRLDALYNIATQSKWIPYLAVGVGDLEREYNAATPWSDRETLVNLGAGIKRDLGNNWQFRTDLRAFNSLDNEYTDLAVNVGLSYLFGKKSEPVVAEVVAPAPVEDRDSDGDGVMDSRDKCPDTKRGLKVDDVGCPVILEKTLEVKLDILFDTNKAIVKDEYLSQVKKLADTMNQYENTVVVVEGHTDSTGSNALNQKLSQNRADAVKAALINKYGITEDRVTAIGYGETRPIANNDTIDGRAENRRVVGAISVKVREAQTK